MFSIDSVKGELQWTPFFRDCKKVTVLNLSCLNSCYVRIAWVTRIDLVSLQLARSLVMYADILIKMWFWKEKETKQIRATQLCKVDLSLPLFCVSIFGWIPPVSVFLVKFFLHTVAGNQTCFRVRFVFAKQDDWLTQSCDGFVSVQVDKSALRPLPPLPL